MKYKKLQHEKKVYKTHKEQVNNCLESPLTVTNKKTKSYKQLL